MPREYFVVGTFKASTGRQWWRVSRDDRGDLSCTCPGWCRRVAKDGSRSCKHVQKVVERDELQVVPGDTRKRGRPEKPVQDRLGRRRFRL